MPVLYQNIWKILPSFHVKCRHDNFNYLNMVLASSCVMCTYTIKFRSTCKYMYSCTKYMSSIIACTVALRYSTLEVPNLYNARQDFVLARFSSN